MRSFTFLLLFTVSFSLSAVTRTSIVNGMWSNSSTWSPAGVPAFTDDVIVNTAVSYNQDIALNGALFHITASGSLQDMALDTISFGGNLFLNEGYMSAAGFAIGAADSAVNYGTITVDEFSQSGLMINHSSGIICAGTQMFTSDSFVNDGSISAGLWGNSGITTGTNGKFCVAGYFINSDQISGTIDICDATPNQPGDANVGTIAGTVTFCQVGPCAQCTLTSIPEVDYNAVVTVYPHPVTSVSVIEIMLPLSAPQSEMKMQVMDISGRIIRTISFSGTQVMFDRAGLESGVYFYQFSSGGEIAGTGKLLIQ